MSTANGAAELADERRWQYREIGCARCGARVLAAKFSMPHISVQWSAQAARQCAEFTERAAAGQPSALVRSCGSLTASIDTAVAAGKLEVLPP